MIDWECARLSDPACDRVIVTRRARELGRDAWIQDVIRHSYASHWLKAFEDKGRLLSYMGHATDDMLLDNYLRAVDRKTAAHWEIGPTTLRRVWPFGLIVLRITCRRVQQKR